MPAPPLDSSTALSAIQKLRWFWVAVLVLFLLGNIGLALLGNTGFGRIALMLFPAFIAFIITDKTEAKTRARLRQYSDKHDYKCCPKCAYPLQQTPENTSGISMDCTECGEIYNTGAAIDYWKSMTKVRRGFLRACLSARKPRPITDIETLDPNRILKDDEITL